MAPLTFLTNKMAVNNKPAIKVTKVILSGAGPIIVAGLCIIKPAFIHPINVINKPMPAAIA